MKCVLLLLNAGAGLRAALLLTVVVMTPMVKPQDGVDDQKTVQQEKHYLQEQQPGTSDQQQKALKPHIVFILADDLGFNDVSWHNDAVFMPTLHSLAQKGVILESSYTQPVCTPARAALLTGRHPHTIGRQAGALEALQPTGLDPSLRLLPETLQRVGYTTHMVGKWHLGFCNWNHTPTLRGFDTFYGFYNSGGNYYSKMSRTRFKIGNITQLVSGYDRRLQRQVYRSDSNEYSTFEFGRQAETVIGRHDARHPLFLYLSFQAVHGPVDAPRDFEDFYYKIKNKKRRRYLGMVSALDEAVHGVVKALKKAGLYDNSVIVFTSDNGGSPRTGGNNWPLRGYKHTPYEGGIRGVTFVHSPLLQHRGRVHNNLFHITDWFPTLSGLAGAPLPPSLDGVDQWDSLNFRGPPPRDRIVMILEGGRRIKALVRERDWKLLVAAPQCHGHVEPPEGFLQISKETFFAQRVSYMAYLLRKSNEKLSSRERRFLNTSGEMEADIVKADQDILADSLVIDEEYDDEFENVTYQHNVKGKKLKWRACKESVMRTATLHDDRQNITEFKEQLSLLRTTGGMQLFNIKADPNEKLDLSKRHDDTVRHLLELLNEELLRVVPVDDPKPVSRGFPSNFGGNWSPGWC